MPELSEYNTGPPEGILEQVQHLDVQAFAVAAAAKPHSSDSDVPPSEIDAINGAFATLGDASTPPRVPDWIQRSRPTSPAWATGAAVKTPHHRQP